MRTSFGLLLLLLSFYFAPLASADPSQRTLALYLATQVPVTVGHTDFSTPPPPNRFAVLVSEAAQNPSAAAAQLLEAPKGVAAIPALVFGGDSAGALSTIKAVASPGSPLALLAQIEGASQISEMAGQVQQNMQLLALAMEKSGGTGNFFLTVSAKGAIQAWNQLVNGVVDKMESLYKEPAPEVKLWEALRNFLMNPETQAFRGVLAGFSEQKAAP